MVVEKWGRMKDAICRATFSLIETLRDRLNEWDKSINGILKSLAAASKSEISATLVIARFLPDLTKSHSLTGGG
ncbi:MAG: hypothetical protein KME22_13720 [Hassallia sp. WJT32-NPBG1]|nr:hypothetical protein [Hassallia sp. WJT32-NPBG1]